MARVRLFTAMVIALSIAIAAPVAQAQAPEAPKASRLKMTTERVKELLAKWRQNRPKLKMCRAEARKKGLAGDDRWFFLSDCMDKS
jgi:psiF repeat